MIARAASHRLSPTEAARRYADHVERGNNAVHEVTAEREFRLADVLAKQYGVGPNEWSEGR